jgi:hypothetical protein
LTDEFDFIVNFGVYEEIARRNEQPKLSKNLSFVSPLKSGLGETRSVVDSQRDYCDLGGGGRHKLIARLIRLDVDEYVQNVATC